MVFYIFSDKLFVTKVCSMVQVTEADGAQFYSKIIISTIDEAPGTARVPKCQEETTQFNFLGFWCNHMVLEPLQAKNLPKRARDTKKAKIFEIFGL